MTEYELPRPETLPHDAAADSAGMIWYSDFGSHYLGMLDPKTGKATENPIPVTKPGAHGEERRDFARRRWFAYESNDSGRPEIYVRPFPDANSGRWQVSTGGGTRPLWARDGQELFYIPPAGGLMRVSVDRATSWKASAPTKLLEGPYAWVIPGLTLRTYDISPNGSRFLLFKPVSGNEQAATPPSLIIVQNWFEELKRLVPTR